jgi:hypothetical protein
MGFLDKHYTMAVKDVRTGELISSGVYTFVYSAGTKTLATLYNNLNRTSLANPITRAQFALSGQIDFWSSEASVDVFVADDLGNTAFVSGLTENDHVLMLDRSGAEKCMVAPFVFNAGGTETDTGLDFPVNSYIKDFLVEVVTVDATETLGIGLLSSETAGDADGIAALVPLDNAGFLKPYSITDGATEDYVGATYWGALMGIGSTGTNTANDFGQSGGPGHVVSGSNAKSLVYIPSTSDTAAGYIYVFFRKLR